MAIPTSLQTTVSVPRWACAIYS